MSAYEATKDMSNEEALKYFQDHDHEYIEVNPMELQSQVEKIIILKTKYLEENKGGPLTPEQKDSLQKLLEGAFHA